MQEALDRIGGSVWHAAITTFLSVICLVFCTVAIFSEFGAIIAASVISSITFALLVLPSLLVAWGPTTIAQGSFLWRHFLAALIALVVCFVLFAIVYAYDYHCGGCVKGPAGAPLFGDLGQ